MLAGEPVTHSVTTLLWLVSASNTYLSPTCANRLNAPTPDATGGTFNDGIFNVDSS